MVAALPSLFSSFTFIRELSQKINVVLRMSSAWLSFTFSLRFANLVFCKVVALKSKYLPFSVEKVGLPRTSKQACILGWFRILMFWSWDLCTSHLICTTLMIISSYSEDFCHLQPLRASHRKFSGTVGDIENRTSPNPPFMGIQTSVCGHWSQRCMISGVLTWFWALKRPKTMKNDFYLENSHFLQFFSIFRY